MTNVKIKNINTRVFIYHSYIVNAWSTSFLVIPWLRSNERITYNLQLDDPYKTLYHGMRTIIQELYEITASTAFNILKRIQRFWKRTPQAGNGHDNRVDTS